MERREKEGHKEEEQVSELIEYCPVNMFAGNKGEICIEVDIHHDL